MLREHGRSAGEVSDRDALSAGLGLSSSQVAELVSRIGVSLQAAPSARVAATTDLATVGDLVHAWQRALAGQSGGTDADELQASRMRAQARRDRPAG